MRLICVSGIKGSGKTTLIKAMVRKAVAFDKPSAVIVNESGKESYEDAFIDDLKVPVKYLRGG